MRDVLCFGSTTDLVGRVYEQDEKLNEQRREINNIIFGLNLLQRKVEEKEGKVGEGREPVAFLPNIGFHRGVAEEMSALRAHPYDFFYEDLAEWVDAIEKHNDYIFDKVVHKYNETFEVLTDIAKRMQAVDCVQNLPPKNNETKPEVTEVTLTDLSLAVGEITRVSNLYAEKFKEISKQVHQLWDRLHSGNETTKN
jgi:hypothetical protein